MAKTSHKSWILPLIHHKKFHGNVLGASAYLFWRHAVNLRSKKATLMFEGTTLVREPNILIRPLQNVEEMSIAKLQHRIWGYSALDTVPIAFIVAGVAARSWRFTRATRGFARLRRHPSLNTLSAFPMVGVVPEFQNRALADC
jgi:hypothetical protein